MQHYLSYQLLGNSVESWLYFMAIMLITALLSPFILKYFIKVLDYLIHKGSQTLDAQIIVPIRRPLKLLVYTMGFYFAFYTVHLPFSLDEIAKGVLKSFIIIGIFWTLHALVGLLKETIDRFASKFGKDLSRGISIFIAKSIKVLVIIIGFMTLMQHWGYNISGFVASLGLGGLAFALAAKDTASNLFGSVVIFTDKPFEVDDWIQTPDVEGTIEEIGIRSTKVRTFAHALVSVPNANLANSAVINWSRMGKRRIKTTLGLLYSTSQEQIIGIMDDIRAHLKNHPDIHQETIMIQFSGFGDSSLDIFCYFFTKTTKWAEFLQVQEAVFLEFMAIVEKHNTAFAYPSRSIYLEKELT